MRLDKALTLAGLSRTEAKKAVRAGRVQVAGKTALKADVQVNEKDVLLDGNPLPAGGDVHIMLNKPAGVITAMQDNHGPTVGDLLPENLLARDIGPVGRLDKDVTGLVILTSNGQLAHRLISPKRKAEKCYIARVTGRLEEKHIRAFAEGLELSDFTAMPASLEILDSGEEFSVAKVIIMEGKFHQVKRMFIAIGHPVETLRRVRIGCVQLDENLPEGKWRYLNEEEITGLMQIAGLDGE